MIPTQDQFRVFHDLSRTLITILRSPSSSSSPSLPYDDVADSVPSMKPAGLASLMLGISMGMMVCGSVTFVIGFMLMPWVLGLMMLVVLVGVVSGVSVVGRWVVESCWESCTNRKDYARVMVMLLVEVALECGRIRKDESFLGTTMPTPSMDS
ncbi:hypothetical protein AKJ16_DCAP20392 [Drosera capensis]